ncbi:MAG TPA: formate dehydrogenase accessory sulfurtransferase FdhD [Opitutaceae bacterium]|nr:formate dehydrogenase accessory sulfurtransferase FdhD [Opitutaceae bacterium]
MIPEERSRSLSDEAAPAVSIQNVPSLHWSATDGPVSRSEDIAIEAALCIEISYTRAGTELIKPLGITMRTPGNDRELAVGFLLGEGVITAQAEVQDILSLEKNAAGEDIDTIRVLLRAPPRNDLSRVSRAVTTTSACGLCGRATLQGLPVKPAREGAEETVSPRRVRLDTRTMIALPKKLRERQSVFAKTGGTHAAALADVTGKLLLCHEDVGRHNAVDKVFGAALLGAYPLSGCMLVLSGRASFELVQKSAAAGAALIVAVGAPSSAAVSLAHAADITLIGFTRNDRFNVYTRADRVVFDN